MEVHEIGKLGSMQRPATVDLGRGVYVCGWVRLLVSRNATPYDGERRLTANQGAREHAEAAVQSVGRVPSARLDAYGAVLNGTKFRFAPQIPASITAGFVVPLVIGSDVGLGGNRAFDVALAALALASS